MNAEVAARGRATRRAAESVAGEVERDRRVALGVEGLRAALGQPATGVGVVGGAAGVGGDGRGGDRASRQVVKVRALVAGLRGDGLSVARIAASAGVPAAQLRALLAVPIGPGAAGGPGE